MILTVDCSQKEKEGREKARLKARFILPPPSLTPNVATKSGKNSETERIVTKALSNKKEKREIN